MRLIFYNAKILKYLRSHAVHEFICARCNASYARETQRTPKLGSMITCILTKNDMFFSN